MLADAQLEGEYGHVDGTIERRRGTERGDFIPLLYVVQGVSNVNSYFRDASIL